MLARRARDRYRAVVGRGRGRGFVDKHLSLSESSPRLRGVGLKAFKSIGIHDFRTLYLFNSLVSINLCFLLLVLKKEDGRRNN